MGRSAASGGLYNDHYCDYFFECVLTWFRCLKILTSDRGTHFLNETINAMWKNFRYTIRRAHPITHKQTE